MSTIDPTFETLEDALGDPFASCNPFGIEAFLDADAKASCLRPAYQLLEGLGVQRLFIPPGLDGAMADVPSIIRTLQPAFSRDASFGLSFGVTTLMAALNVWHSGSDEQQERMASLIATGRPVAVAYHELDHGNDLASNDLKATRTAFGYSLTGRKEVINNAQAATAAVVFARTSDRPGRSHSLFLVDLDSTNDTVTRLERFRTTSLSGAQLGGLEFTGHPVSEGDRVGAEGHAIEIALKSFQVSRVVMAGAGLGPVDLALHATASFARQRVVYGRRVDTINHARTNLAIAQALLLAVEATVNAAAVALHTAPELAGARAAAVKYISPILLEVAIDHLAVVLGARFYLRTGPFSIVGKHYRDLSPIGIGHAGSTSCLLTLMPQIRHLLGTEGVQDVSQSTDPTGPLDLSRLTLRCGSPDPLFGVLESRSRYIPGALDLGMNLKSLRAAAAQLPSVDLGVAAPSAAFDMAEQYTKLFVSAAAIDTSLRDPSEFSGAWVRIALAAIAAHRRGRPNIAPADVDLVMRRIDHHLEQQRSLLAHGQQVQRSIPILETRSEQ